MAFTGTAISKGKNGETTLLTIDRIEDSGLAERLLVLGRRVAAVVAVLMTTNAAVRVSLIWLLREIRYAGRKREGNARGFSSRRTWKRGA